MAKQQITQIVNPSAEQQIERITAKLNDSNTALLKNIESAKKFTTALANSKGLKDLRTNVDALAKASQSVNDKAVTSIQLARQKAELAAVEKKNQGIDITNKSKQVTLDSKLNREKEKAAAATRKVAAQTEKENNAYKKLVSSVDKARNAFKKIAATNGVNSKQAKKALAAFIKVDNVLARINAKARDGSRQVGRYGRAFGKLRGSLVGVASAAGVSLGIFGLFRLVGNSIRTVKNFESAMLTLAGVYRTSRESLASLEAEIRRIGATSVRTSTETAQLAEVLATLGKTAPEVENLLQSATNLSIGLKTTSKDAGEFLVQSLNAFGGASSEAKQYANVIGSIRTQTSLNFQKMRDSFQYLSPISRLLNEDLAYTGALIGIVADNGIKAEQAGRLLASAQLRIAGKSASLADALAAVNKAQEEGANGQELLSIANKIFGVNAAKVGIVLANNSKIIQKNAAAIRNSRGALDDLVNSELSSLDSALKLLNSAWQDYLIDADEASGSTSRLKTAIRFLTENLAEVISAIGITIGLYVGWNIVSGIAAARMAFLAKESVLYNIVQGIRNLRLKIGIAATLLFSRAQDTATASTTRLTVVTRIWNWVLRMNPIILIVSLIAALVAILASATSAFAKNTKAVDANTAAKQMAIEVQTEANKEVTKAMVTERSYVKILRSSTIALRIKRDILQKLIAQSPEYLSKLTLENVKNQEGKDILDKYNKALKSNALIKSQNARADREIEKGKKIEDDIFEVENSINNNSKLPRKSLTSEGIQSVVDDVTKSTVDNSQKGVIFQTVDDFASNLVNADISSNDRKRVIHDELVRRRDEQQLAIDQALSVIEPAEIIEPNPLGGNPDAFDNEDKAAKAKADREAKRRKQLADKAKADLLKRLAAEREAVRVSNELEVQSGIDKNNRIIDNENASLEERLEALMRHKNGQISLLGIAENRELDKTDITKREIENVHAKYDQLRLKAFQQMQDDKIQIIEDTTDREVAAIVKSVDDFADADALETANWIAELDRRYAEGNMKHEDYQEERERLSAFGALSGVNAQIKYNQTQIALLEKDSEARIELEYKTQELINEAAKLGAEGFTKTLKTREEKVAEFFTKLDQMSQTAGAILSEIGEALHEQEIARLDARSSKLEKDHDDEMERIERSGMAGKDLANAKERQEKLTEARRKQIERERITSERKKARFQKASDIAGIISGTALAVVQNLKFPPLAIAVAALGAVQLARAIAAPLPQYAKGTDFHQGGRAVIGEQGVELGILPSGNTFLSKGHAHEVDLPRGTKIKTAAETRDILAYAKPHVNFASRMDDRQGEMLVDMSETNRELKNIVKAVKGQETNVTINDSSRRLEVEMQMKRN